MHVSYIVLMRHVLEPDVEGHECDIYTQLPVTQNQQLKVLLRPERSAR